MRKKSKKKDFYLADNGKAAGRTGGPVSGLLFFVCYFCGVCGYLRLCSLIFRLNYSWEPVALVLAAACVGCWFLQDIVKWKPVFVMGVGIAAAGGMFLTKQGMYLTNMKMLYAAGMWNMKAIPVIKVTGLLCICMILGTLFVYLTANLTRQGWIFYFITFPLVFAAMMEQADLDIWTCLLYTSDAADD